MGALMANKICASCGKSFTARPQVPNQAYCSAPACQSERRQRWLREKIQTDPDYRENQLRNQREWMTRNPDYWRKYRDGNPGYAERNRSRQRANLLPDQPLNGLYLIRTVPRGVLAKNDVWIVEITPACPDCPCKKYACKDRT